MQNVEPLLRNYAENKTINKNIFRWLFTRCKWEKKHGALSSSGYRTVHHTLVARSSTRITLADSRHIWFEYVKSTKACNGNFTKETLIFPWSDFGYHRNRNLLRFFDSLAREKKKREEKVRIWTRRGIRGIWTVTDQNLHFFPQKKGSYHPEPEKPWLSGSLA